MRQPKTPSKLTLAHALMLLAGLTTFILVSAVLNDRRETSTILVASADAPVGSEASALGLEPMEVPASLGLTAQFVKAGSVDGSERIARDVAAGEPLLSSDLLEPNRRVATRTFALAVDELVLRGLELRVSDRVDLIGQDADGRVYYVVADVTVSSLSSRASDSGFAVSNGSFLTVEVTDEQALAISAALRESLVDVVRSTGAEAVQAPGLAPESATPEDAETQDAAMGTNEGVGE